VTPAQQLKPFGAALLLLLTSCGGAGTGTPSPSSTGSASKTPPQGTSGTSSSSPSKSPSSAIASPTKSSPPTAKSAVVHIRNFAYVPAAPVVTVGQPILIINDDTAAHTWSAAPSSGWTYTSGNLDKGQRATYPGFSKAGRYKFLCYYHAEMPSMNGIVTVRAAP
jgi:plastocyanin